MKKILNISVVAALAVLPFAANATPTYGSVPAEPVDATANTNVASTSFVRGAYNAAIAVANKENQRASAAEGDLTTLTTTDQSSLVNAINEVNTAAGFAGTQAALTDTHFSNEDKASAAAAANAAMGAAQTGITDAATAQAAADAAQADADAAQAAADAAQADADALEGIVGDTALQTTSQTVTAAINELKTASDTQGAKVLKVYTTWNTDTNQEVTLTNPTPAQQGD